MSRLIYDGHTVHMSRKLEHMRTVLASWGLDKTEGLQDMQPDTFGKVLDLVPASTGMVAKTSKVMRAEMAAAVPLPPLWFHVNLNQFPALTHIERIQSMLTELETLSQKFRLFSIEMPGFQLELNDDDPQMLNQLRLSRVLEQRCASLESLDLSGTGITEWVYIDSALPSCVALERVNLSGLVLHELNHPFLGLAQCLMLKELVIRSAMLNTCVQLAPVLVACTAVTKLDLTDNQLGVNRIDDMYPLQHITNALMFHPSLEHLNLRDCQLDIDSMQSLALTLPTCPRLAHLNLSNSSMSLQNINQNLIPMLQQCTALRHLVLSQLSFMEQIGLTELATSKALTGLTSLDISICYIDFRIPPYGEDFIDELTQCTRLTHLDLSDNELGDTSARFLAVKLPKCLALERLDLSSTLMSDEGVRALSKAIPSCTCLTSLKITLNNTTKKTIEEIQDTWEKHRGHTVGLWTDLT